jgi:hypothetical protein
MQDEVFVGNMGVLIEVINALGVKAGRATFDAMNMVAFLEEEF